MATHKGREAITDKNLQSQDCKFIVLIDDIKPLGNKWQRCVDLARHINPNPLIISGSDDFLSKDYIKMVQRLINQGFDLIGLTSWYTYDTKSNKVYHCEYRNRNINFPIGSGKAFSNHILEKMKYRLFDIKLNRKLDDFGYYSAISHGAKIHLIRDPHVLAVKQGDDLNPIESYFNSPNINTKEVNISVLQNFNYAP